MRRDEARELLLDSIPTEEELGLLENTAVQLLLPQSDESDGTSALATNVANEKIGTADHEVRPSTPSDSEKTTSEDEIASGHEEEEDKEGNGNGDEKRKRRSKR